MQYNHVKYDLKKKAVMTEKDGKHFYKTPEGKTYPSVTTVLSKTSSKFGIMEWKKRVGENVAQYISSQAMETGTATHRIIERYLNNTQPDINDLLPLAHLENLKSFLHNICEIYYTEIPLYSDTLKLAGTCDCIAEYKNILSVIDFKTSRKKKDEKWIENYFLQGTAYALMWHEMTGIEINQIVILISGEDGSVDEFVKCPTDYHEKLLKRLRMYK